MEKKTFLKCWFWTTNGKEKKTTKFKSPYTFFATMDTNTVTFQKFCNFSVAQAKFKVHKGQTNKKERTC